MTPILNNLRISLRGLIGFYPICIVLLALALFWSGSAWISSPDHIEIGDFAANALQVENARQFKELLGPYSRFHFHHPGPAIFYYYGACQSLFWVVSTPAARHIIAQILLNCFWLVLIHRYARSIWPDRGWAAALIGIIVLFMVAIPEVHYRALGYPWGPTIVVLPVAVFVIAMGFVAAGVTRAAAVAAMASIVAIQTHLSAAVVVAPVGASALIWYAGRLIAKKSVYNRPALRDTLIASSILLVGWLPPLIEQLTAANGNITQLWTFMQNTPRNVHSLYDSSNVILQGFTIPLKAHAGPMFAKADPADSGFLVLMVLMVLAGSIGHFMRSQGPVRPMIAMAWIGLGAACFSGRNVVGYLHPYLFQYVYGITAFLTFVALKDFLDRTGAEFTVHRWRITAGTSAAAVILAFTFTAILRHPVPAPAAVNPYHELIADLPTDAGRPVEIYLERGGDDLKAWRQLAGLVLQLRRDGRAVSTGSEWDWLITAAERFSEKERRDLIIMRHQPFTLEGIHVHTQEAFSAAVIPDVDGAGTIESINQMRCGNLTPIALGETYGFASSLLFFESWYAAESGWRWSEGNRCRIYLRLPGGATIMNGLKLEMSLGSLGKQIVHVSCNGHAAGSLELNGFGPTSHTLVLGHEFIAPGAINFLEFDIPNARQPKPDSKRILGMNFVGLKLAPLVQK